MLGWFKKSESKLAKEREKKKYKALTLMMNGAADLEKYSMDCECNDDENSPIEYNISFVVESLALGLFFNKFNPSDPGVIRDLADVIQEKNIHDDYIAAYEKKQRESKAIERQKAE